MEQKVYLTTEAFLKQNEELGTGLPFSPDTAILGTPKQIQGKIIRNRLVCQAMEGCDGTPEGSPDELTKRRYERFVKGGAGLIWFEATAVMEEGRANPRQLYITEKNLDDFKRQVEAIKETALKMNGYEPLVIMQATHSGRYSKPHGAPDPLIAYNNPIFEQAAPIADDRIVTDDYLDRVGEALVCGANLAEEAGFDGVDIKCCHRYLNSELLSAYERKGKYGGSFENRTRLLRESVQGTIASCSKEFIVSSRLNVYDGFAYPYGFGVKPDGSLDFDPTEPDQGTLWLRCQTSQYHHGQSLFQSPCEPPLCIRWLRGAGASAAGCCPNAQRHGTAEKAQSGDGDHLFSGFLPGCCCASCTVCLSAGGRL